MPRGLFSLMQLASNWSRTINTNSCRKTFCPRKTKGSQKRKLRDEMQVVVEPSLQTTQPWLVEKYMQKYQFSPVRFTNRVWIALWKVEQLKTSFMFLPQSQAISPMRLEARMDDMNRQSRRIISPFPMAGSEKTKVYISFCSPLKLLTIRSSLVILMTLNILAIWGRIDRAEVPSLLAPLNCRIMSSTEADTTKKSKTFQPERKQLSLNTNSFSNSSQMKMQLKTELRVVRVLRVDWGMSSLEMVMTIMLAMIMTATKISKYLLETTLKRVYRTLLGGGRQREKQGSSDTISFWRFFQLICLLERVLGLILASASWQFMNMTPTSRSMKKRDPMNMNSTANRKYTIWLLSLTGPDSVPSMKVYTQKGQFSRVEKMQRESMELAMFSKLMRWVVQAPPEASQAAWSVWQGPYWPVMSWLPPVLQKLSLPWSRFMPRMANMRNTLRQMIRTLKMPRKDSAREVTIIFISSFRVIILSGLRVLSSLRIERLTPLRDMSIMETHTMPKSSRFQLLLRQVFQPMAKPRCTILIRLSTMNIPLKTQSEILEKADSIVLSGVMQVSRASLAEEERIITNISTSKAVELAIFLQSCRKELFCWNRQREASSEMVSLEVLFLFFIFFLLLSLLFLFSLCSAVYFCYFSFSSSSFSVFFSASSICDFSVVGSSSSSSVGLSKVYQYYSRSSSVQPASQSGSVESLSKPSRRMACSKLRRIQLPRKIQLRRKRMPQMPIEDREVIIQISFQFYMVITWKTVKRALKKVSQFCRKPVTFSLGKLPPKICIPRRVYINTNSDRSKKTYMNQLMMEVTTPMMMRMQLRDRMSLVILRTLKARRMRIDRRAERLVVLPPPRAISIMLTPTTAESKRFIGSVKKKGPQARILRVRSLMKIPVKLWLMQVQGEVSIGTYPLRLMRVVFRITMMRTKLSQAGWDMVSSIFFRITTKRPMMPLM